MMKKLALSLMFLPVFALAFDGVTPNSPVYTDASGSMVCYPNVYAYNGSVGRTYIASTDPVDFTGSGVYSPAITNGGSGRFIKDVDWEASNPPDQTDWDEHSTDYSSSDNSILASWWTDTGVSNISDCDTPPTPVPSGDNADSLYLWLTGFLVTIALSVVFTSLLTGVAFKNLLK